MDAEERWPPAKGSAVKLHNSGLPAETCYVPKATKYTGIKFVLGSLIFVQM